MVRRVSLFEGSQYKGTLTISQQILEEELLIEKKFRDTSRSGCYEVLFRAESHPLEEALGILGYVINGTSGLGIIFQRGKINW